MLCINKADLCRETSAADLLRIPPVLCTIVLCSAQTGEGIDELRGLIEGNTAVLAGHSGAGKSSLLNAPAAGARALTGEVGETGTGRHTTTASRLYTLENGGRIIDTPGIRELGLGPITRAELVAAFPEFDTKGCRFADCLHREEPDCAAVREAGGARYAAWLRLVSELG